MRCKHLALSTIVLALAGTLHAATIYVDGDPNSQTFHDIQMAIDAAQDGDTIIVAPGRYLSQDPWKYAELKFNNRNIRLLSSAPTDFSVTEKTILCGVVIFGGLETSSCRLQGFKIQNHDSGGILGNGTQAMISHCIISGNGPCGATVLKDCTGLIQNCLIADNTTFHGCAVQPVISGCMHLVNCTIANNVSGISLTAGASLHNCIIQGNQGQQILYGGVIPYDIDHGLAYDDAPVSFSYCLVGNWSTQGLSVYNYLGMIDDDPCFVSTGQWSTGQILYEGDYHLRSQGYRWSEADIHGSHWYFDPVTSCAVDAGDPLDGLGEEVERIPDDAEGRWGVNHHRELGVYGGTSQASLTPTQGKPPGVGAVDLRDYWPLRYDTTESSHYWTNTRIPDDGWDIRCPDANDNVSVDTADYRDVNGLDVYATAVYRGVYNGTYARYALCCAYIDYALCMTPSFKVGRAITWPGTLDFQARYPQYLTIGAAIAVPYDALTQEAPVLRSAVVTRGTLAEVLTGTAFDPNEFAGTTWKDVIAFRERSADGAIGAPFTIFARGFGPLMLAGRPVNSALVNGISFDTSSTAP